MDSSFFTRAGEGKYEVHFETSEKWKFVLVEAACFEAIGHAKPLVVAENIVRCRECKYWSEVDTSDGLRYGQCDRPGSAIRGNCFIRESWFCADGEREVQDGQ